VWALGVKEVWKVPRKLDRVIHTLGWPLRYGARHKEFGGSWIYPMGEDRVSIGFVVGLDYTDATVSGHDLLQQFKTSKLVRRILEGGERVAWGAKAIPEGGATTNAMVISKGRVPGGRWRNHRDAESPVAIGDKKDGYPKPDGKYTFDKLSSVYITGNATRDDAPNHIRVRENVPREVAEAW